MKRLTRSRTKHVHEGGQLESLSFAVKKRKSEKDEDESEPKQQLKNKGSSRKHNPSTSTSSSFEGNGQNNSNNNNEEVEEEEHLCTKQFNILKHIFENLPIADLTKAAQVSILWSQVGRVVRRQRLNHPYIMIYHGPFPMDTITTTKELVDYFNTKLPPGGYRPWGPFRGGGYGWRSTIGSSPAIPIDNQIKKLNLDYPLSWNPRKLLNYVDEFEPALWKSFQSHWEPQAILCFGTTTVGGNCWRWDQQGMRSHMLARVDHQKAVLGENHVMSDHEALFGRMEKVVPCIGVLGTGLLTTLPDDSGTTELEHPRLPMMASLAIPMFPGLRVKVITFGSNNYQKYKQTYWRNKGTCERFLNISDGDNVKGIVFFDSRPDMRVGGRSVMARVVSAYLKINPEIGVGGGCISDCYSSTMRKNNSKVFSCGLVFCCDENVQVGVSVLSEPGMTSGNEKQILKFKEAGMDKDAVCSFALVFASKNRGLKMHGHEDAETSMFRRHYPNTPIIGAFTESEWSHEYIPGQQNDSGKPYELIFDEKKGSSVFFFVSCKKPASPY